MHPYMESDKIVSEVYKVQKSHLEKEWSKLLAAEGKFLSRNTPVKEKDWQAKIAGFVPQKLETTLNTAFFKAFELIFDRGTPVIEKTYQKQRKEQNYKINEYAADVRNTHWSLRAFGREAGASKSVNMALSTIEGVGMGIIGMGIPDIPVFLGVLLKSIYEIALSYGFSYDTGEEQIFILKLIETAISHEEALARGNMELNLWISGGGAFDISRSGQERITSDALSRELLYLKFVQGIPVLGVVGGVSDMVYQKKISDYAALKYKRRFLEKKRQNI